MGVQVKADAFLELVDESAEVEQLGTGFTFTEGPIWNPEGFLLFSDMPGDVRRRWDPDSGVSEVANPSNKGNGMTIDNDGRLVVCEHVTSSVVRMDPDGKGGGREVLATHYEGRELNSPNDVVVKSDGAIYFTDPTYGRMPGFGIEREQELDFQGVYRIAPGGGDPQLLVDDFDQPNGLCFSTDESLLYINDTTRAHIRVFDVQPDGTIANSRVLAEGIGSGSLEIGDLVDGMKLDERGNVWVTGPGGVCVFDPDGNHIGTVEVPENVGNLNWARPPGGPDWNWLMIPATTSVYRIQCKVSGNRLPYMR
jgi:gluconolactonase